MLVPKVLVIPLLTSAGIGVDRPALETQAVIPTLQRGEFLGEVAPIVLDPRLAGGVGVGEMGWASWAIGWADASCGMVSGASDAVQDAPTTVTSPSPHAGLTAKMAAIARVRDRALF